MSSDHRAPEWVTAASLAAGLSGLLALLGLTGTLLAIPWMKSLLPGAVDMKVNTAIGLLLANASIQLLEGNPLAGRRQAAQILGLLLAGLGFFTACEWCFGWHAGIDEIFFRDPTDHFHGRSGASHG